MSVIQWVLMLTGLVVWGFVAMGVLLALVVAAGALREGYRQARIEHKRRKVVAEWAAREDERRERRTSQAAEDLLRQCGYSGERAA